jgi:hypothetical protein
LRSRSWKLRFWEYPKLLSHERAQREAAEAAAAEERSRRIEAEELLQRDRDASARDATHGENPTKGSPHDNLDVPGSTRLGEPYSTWPSSHAGTPNLLIGQMGNVLSLLTLLGLVIYAVATLGYRAFYDVFNVSPEEAGLSYAPILTQAAIGISFIGTLLILDLLFDRPPVISLRLTTIESALPLLWLFTMAIVVSLFWGFEGRRIWIGAVIIAVVSVIFLLLLGAWQSREPGPGAFSSAATLLVLTLLFSPSFAGSSLASDLRQGREASSSDFGLINVQARKVEVAWVQTKPPPWWPPASEEFLYLGQSGGTVVLYERTERVVHRLPAEAIIMSDSSDR